MATNVTTISARFEKASEVLKISRLSLKKVFKVAGISDDSEGLKYLNSRIATQEAIEDIIKEKFSSSGKFLISAAAMYLRGEDPFEPVEEKPFVEINPENPTYSSTTVDSIFKFIQANRPIQQLKDRELLELWAQERDHDMEIELHKRAKFQPFIVLNIGKHEPGKESIDIETSLDLLKTARKRINPTIIPYKGNTFASVYKITELNIDDRIIELCPICDEILYKGYCPNCESNLAGVGDDERAYLKLIVNSGKINTKSLSDRNAMLVSAGKGLEDLRITWPGIWKAYEELKLTNSLPKLRKIEDRPAQRPADPFNVLNK